MTDRPQPMANHEPAAETIDLVCDRLADLDLAVGPETARDLVRAILTAEGPRLEARLRDALETSLQTIHTAAQSGLAMIASTLPSPERSEPVAKPAPAPAPTRPIARRRPDDRPREEVTDHPVERPVFKRPRGR